MQKYILTSILLLVFFLTFLISFKDKVYNLITNKNTIVTIPSVDKMYISIPKIKLNSELTINSIKSEVKGVVIFSEYGRPDNNKNTIIGAHSGNSKNSYFKNIHKLKNNDVININYKSISYEYYVDSIYEVDEKDIRVLEKEDDNILILITCKNNDDRKRIIVEGKMAKLDK